MKDQAEARVDRLASWLTRTRHRLARRTLDAKRPTLGLALGSGAARGLAHIGVLEVMEEHGIPIDLIAGCSMGAVIGGLYASGMSTAEMRRIASGIDRRTMIRYTDLAIVPKSGLLLGRRIDDLLADLTRRLGFDDLVIPFVCSSVDICTGQEIPLEQGIVHEAIRASISVPGVFTPVELGENYLVDGGVVNPVPVDYLVAAGADIRVGVDVIPSLKAEGKASHSTLTVLMNTFDLMGRAVADRSTDMATVMIRPDVNGYSALEFWEAEELMKRGRDAAFLAVPDIIQALGGVGHVRSDFHSHVDSFAEAID